MKIITKFIILILFLTLLMSCSSMKTQKSQFVGIEKKLKVHNYSGAISGLRSAKDEFYTKKDRVIYYLDLGMLYHYNKQFEKSNQMLSKAERAIDELYTKSISRAAASMLLNDNVLEYSGEDYEDVYLNVFKGLNYIALNKFDDAFVEIRKINIKLSKLEAKHTKMADQLNLSKDKKTNFKAGKNKFHNSALGRFLSMLLYRIEDQYDDARIDLDKIRKAWELQSQVYDHPQPNFSSYLKNSDKVKVDLISFVGRAPEKKANTLYIHTEKDMIIIGTTKENPRHKENLETLDVINWAGVKKGYHFKFQVPKMKKRRSNANTVKINVDGRTIKELQLIESIENVAKETYKVKKPLVYLKTITRSILKGLFAEKRKSEMESKIDNPLLGFAARLATDVAVDATENADLRISRYFPAKALIGEIELSPGEHVIKFDYYSRTGSIIYSDDLGKIEISEQNVNILESFYLN